MATSEDRQRRATRHAALGEPTRLAIIDELATSDRAPIELRQRFDLESNLLAHHLDVLEEVGLITRTRSSGDGRRRYVHLLPGTLADLSIGPRLPVGPAVFVCTRNSARSQLAAALWQQVGGSASSAGTHPADAVHPGAVAAAHRAGLDITGANPQELGDLAAGTLVVTVCDQAHEELGDRPGWLHWSIPDPVAAGTPADFDHALHELRTRIATVTRAAA
ncbi:helix-turn-helix domain-containing protein [Aquihabitans sp. G128]|uniref:arsenate reductase/protein-tyrosine-phosphatase family protein n=1 Tax=Aquihabitans sp. G128 TaxID=2849779 RepID=UPI001C2113A9|nr:helix-turn-helix domain-containing protein [Aquihabitans sp. G128]QXC60576.1 helix-turn-helix domain-containing protein [Aquihabitans sp. G128]